MVRALIGARARTSQRRFRDDPGGFALRLAAIATLVLTAGAARPIAPDLSFPRHDDTPSQVGYHYRASRRMPAMSSVAVPAPVERPHYYEPPLQSVNSGRRTALIVGINHAHGGSTLPGSVTDATNLRDALKMYGFKRNNVRMLLEEGATRAAILHELDLLADRTPRDGIAVFGIATHTRRRGSQNELLTADGLRISSSELAEKLGRVHAPMWVTLPTCYAGGYALPGIVGHNRIATFASPSNEPTYQLGSSGSYLILYMVKKAMLGGRAPQSVETAFDWARDAIEEDSPDRVPSMSDGIAGDLVLGSPPIYVNAGSPRASHRNANPSRRPSSQYREDSSSPSSTPAPHHGSRGVQMCGRYQVRCQR